MNDKIIISFYFFMLSLNIDMFSLELKKNIIQNDDTIRISITALPERSKKNITFEAPYLKKVRPSFSVNINEKTEKILIVFRKKKFSDNDPILGSIVIPKGEFPTNFDDIANTELKLIDLLEPLQHLTDKCVNRKIIGRFYIQFSLSYVIYNIRNVFNNTITNDNNNDNEKENNKIDINYNRVSDNLGFLYNMIFVN